MESVCVCVFLYLSFVCWFDLGRMRGSWAVAGAWGYLAWVAAGAAAAPVLGTRVPSAEELTPIRDIQYTQYAAQRGELVEECYSSMMVGQEVVIWGTVTARTETSLYVQEASAEWAGVEVYLGSGSGGFNVYCPPGSGACVAGDVIYVNGVVQEYFGMTRIKLLEAATPFLTVMTQSTGANATAGSTGTTMVPIKVSTGLLGGEDAWRKGVGCHRDGELYEGALVKLNNVVIQQREFNSYGEILVDDGTGPCWIENDLLNTDTFFTNALQGNADFESRGLLGVFVEQIVGVVKFSALPVQPDKYEVKYEVVPRTTNDITLDANAIRGRLYDYSAPAPPEDLTAWKTDRDTAFAVGLTLGILLICVVWGMCWLRECYAQKSREAYLQGEKDGLRGGGVDIENPRDWQRSHNGRP